MAFDLKSLSQEATIKAPRILLLGTEKIGKTTFACGSKVEGGIVTEIGLNSPVVISMKGEEGADEFAVPKFPVAMSHDDVMEAIGSLYSEDHDMQTVVLDSASALEPLIWSSLCDKAKVETIEKVGGGYGKGYIEALDFWRKITDGLDALRASKGMASIIIGHTKVKSVNNPDTEPYDAYMMDINDKAANLLYRWADLILFANVKVMVKTGESDGFKKVAKGKGVDISRGQRFLFTQKRPSHPGGGRGVYGHLPYEIPLDWASFQDAVKNVVQ